MAIYKVVAVDESDILRKRSKEVVNINDNVRKMLKNMAETMVEFKGIGLAAPQIGILKRMIVVDYGEGLIELINPSIVSAEGEQTGVEGCLSVPGITGEVSRAKKITIKGLNRDGREVEYEISGFPAVVFQHEIDHLDGILFIDKATNIQKA